METGFFAGADGFFGGAFFTIFFAAFFGGLFFTAVFFMAGRADFALLAPVFFFAGDFFPFAGDFFFAPFDFDADFDFVFSFFFAMNSVLCAEMRIFPGPRDPAVFAPTRTRHFRPATSHSMLRRCTTSKTFLAQITARSHARTRWFESSFLMTPLLWSYNIPYV